MITNPFLPFAKNVVTLQPIIFNKLEERSYRY